LRQKPNKDKKAIDETNRRRAIQKAYNDKNGIIPKTIVKEVHSVLEITSKAELEAAETSKMSATQRKALIEKLTAEMKRAAKELDFETAALLRDRIKRIAAKAEQR
jgi:excinuclease ABC subunit B